MTRLSHTLKWLAFLAAIYRTRALLWHQVRQAWRTATGRGMARIVTMSVQDDQARWVDWSTWDERRPS